MDSRKELEGFLHQLRGYLWHSTSATAFRAILISGEVLPSNRLQAKTSDTSLQSNCRQLGGVSLFDLRDSSAAARILSDDILEAKWSGEFFRHRPSVYLAFASQKVHANIVAYCELKRQFGLGGAIPHIEVCHRGPIPVKEIKSVAINLSGNPDALKKFSNCSKALEMLAEI
ncbi:MAG: hypothetical protein HY302_09885 [Opitutae bacterium]|nr:hypothetical protein [Opitutae bacterium]